jgi:hypothetical protein
MEGQGAILGPQKTLTFAGGRGPERFVRVHRTMGSTFTTAIGCLERSRAAGSEKAGG